MMTIIEDGLYKSSNYMLRSLPTDTGVDVTIVDLKHRKVVEEGFYDFGLKMNPKLRDFLEYFAPEFIANDFFDKTTDVSDDQASWDSLEDIKNNVHSAVEISDIYNANNDFEFDGTTMFVDYKIYDPATLRDSEPCLMASGSMLINANEKIYSKLASMYIEGAKDTVSEYILLNKTQELLRKPNVLNSGRIMQDVIKNINHDDNNVYFIESLDKYTEDDYKQFQNEIIKYGLEDIVDGAKLSYSKINENNCINVYGAIKAVFDDKAMFFKEECQEKKLSLDSLKRKPVVSNENKEVIKTTKSAER